LHHFSHGHLEIFLRHVDSSFPQRVHSGFGADTLKPFRSIPLHENTHSYFTLTSAPLAPGINSAIFLKLIPLVRFIFLEWILRMSSLASSFGGGNSILRSILPGLNKAGSSMSILLVAMITLMFLVASKPSSWLRSSNIVLCTSESPPDPDSMRDDPIESISSMKMIEGACSRAITNSSRTIREPSPMNFWTSSEPETRMKVHSVWWATARASNVFPVPEEIPNYAILNPFLVYFKCQNVKY
jgi:hypothetical protein